MKGIIVIRKQITSFILMLCLVQASLMHAFSPVDCVKSFARQHTVVAASLLISVVAGVAILLYKKNNKTVVSENVPSMPAIEHVVTEPEVEEIFAIEKVVLPVQEAIETVPDMNPASEEKEKKTLVTIEMTPLYSQSKGSYEAYLQ